MIASIAFDVVFSLFVAGMIVLAGFVVNFARKMRR